MGPAAAQHVMRLGECPHPRPLSRERETGGMTLIELLVVLTILAILSAAAVVSTEAVLSQGRFEATQRTMRSVEEAVLGPDRLRTEDGTIATAGFVADVGRLPVAVEVLVDGETEMQPVELWENVSGLPEFGFKPAPDDSDVVLPCGWRGPYLRLPVGADLLSDGWGGRFELLDESGNPTAAGEEVAMIRSLGADALEAEEPGEVYSRDTEIAFTSAVAPVTNRYQTSISVTVWQRRSDDGGLEVPSGSGQLTVRLYGSEEGDIAATPVSVPLQASDVEGRTPVQLLFDQVALGPHVIRAYEESGTQRKSPPLTIHVHPQGPTSWQLVLPAISSP